MIHCLRDLEVAPLKKTWFFPMWDIYQNVLRRFRPSWVQIRVIMINLHCQGLSTDRWSNQIQLFTSALRQFGYSVTSLWQREFTNPSFYPHIIEVREVHRLCVYKIFRGVLLFCEREPKDFAYPERGVVPLGTEYFKYKQTGYILHHDSCSESMITECPCKL